MDKVKDVVRIINLFVFNFESRYWNIFEIEIEVKGFYYFF